MGGRGSSFSGGGGGFREFTDKARDGWSYYGDGKDVVKFFKDNSNYDELISNMDYDERAAFRRWASGAFMDGQQYGGWDSMRGTDQIKTQIYDDVLDRSYLAQGVVLTRSSDAQLVLGAGNKRPSLEALQAMEGSIVESRGSMSFGAAAEGLTIGQRGKNVEYKLSIPGGTTGSGMFIGDHRINGWGPDQREFMTNRNILLKVGKTTYNSSTKTYTVNIEYMGHTAHDYGTSGRIPKT